jgi:hypothetical protein
MRYWPRSASPLGRWGIKSKVGGVRLTTFRIALNNTAAGGAVGRGPAGSDWLAMLDLHVSGMTDNGQEIAAFPSFCITIK